MQATMFQPVGGMDRIPYAFASRLGGVVKYRCAVKEIRKTSNGVRIVYSNEGSRATRWLNASYCICTLPISVLAATQNDLSPRVKSAIAQVAYVPGYKIAWQSRRFWEQDDNIYGGLSFLRQNVDVVWYPSYGLFSPNGAIISGYSIENSSPFGKLPTMQAKFDASRQAVEKLFPGRGKELRDPIYVSWGQIPFNLGSWISGSRRGGTLDQDPLDYAVMTRPDRRVYFAGDHTSHIVGWQEGAAFSAIRAVNMIGQKVQPGGNTA